MFTIYWRVVFRPFWRSILLLAVLAALVAAMGVVSVGLVVPLVTVLTSPDGGVNHGFIRAVMELFGRHGIMITPQGYLLVTLVGICGAVAIRGLFLILAQRVTYGFAIDGWHSIYRRMFRAYMSVRYSEMARRGKGTVLQDIQAPAAAMSEVISGSSKALLSATELIMLSAFIVYLAWWVAVMYLIIGGVALYVGRRVVLARADRYNRQAYEIFQGATRLIVDALDGVRVVKMADAARRLAARLDQLLARHRRLGIRYGVLAEVPAASLELLALVPLAVIVAWGAWGGGPLPVAILSGIVAAIVRIRIPALALSQATLVLAANLRKVEVIDETLNRLPVEDERRGIPPPDQIDKVELDEVGFSYPDRPEAGVQDVTLRFRRGEVTAIVGPTGSGKTTIADLLVRFYEPQRGVIRVAGPDLRDIQINAWRCRVGYVGQDSFLFNVTLRENITLWDDAVDDHRFLEASIAAQLPEFVISLPDGYETVVGDRGLRLSGGQRQRVAIARAILHRPALLIFDEATSALDNVTERAVHAAISELRKDAIIILIAHRLSTVRDADHIVVLRDGRVVEQGSHESLLERRGVYWELYERWEDKTSADGASVERG